MGINYLIWAEMLKFDFGLNSKDKKEMVTSRESKINVRTNLLENDGTAKTAPKIPECLIETQDCRWILCPSKNIWELCVPNWKQFQLQFKMESSRMYYVQTGTDQVRIVSNLNSIITIALGHSIPIRIFDRLSGESVATVQLIPVSDIIMKMLREKNIPQ